MVGFALCFDKKIKIAVVGCNGHCTCQAFSQQNFLNMNTVRAKEIGKRAAMTVKRLRCGFDQHLSIGEQCHEGVSRFKSEGLSRTTVPCHFRRIDPHEANRFARIKNQRIAVNKFGDLTEPLFGLGKNRCGTK